MSKKHTHSLLPLDTLIEVISTNGQGKRYKKVITLDEANKLPKKQGWVYSFFQLGYSAYIDVIEIK